MKTLIRQENAVLERMRHPAAQQPPRPAGSGHWSRLSKKPSRILAGVAILLAGVAAIAGVDASASAADGPLTQTKVKVAPGNGFGGGTIHYPTDAKGRLPAVVIAPAFGAGKGGYEWNAAKLATHGFVAFVIDTKKPGDRFAARRDQILAAVDYLAKASPVSDRVDASRMAVEGDSASAVGAILAGIQRPSLKAVVALAPVSAGIRAKDVGSLSVPSLLVCGESDSWAPPSQCQALADGIPGSTPKQTVTVPGAGHGFATDDDDVAFPAELSWLQQHVAGGAESPPVSGPQSPPVSGPQSPPVSGPQGNPAG